MKHNKKGSMYLLLIEIKFSQWTYHSYHLFFKVVVDNWKFTTILWKVLDIHWVIQKTWTVISGFLLIKERHWGSYLMISTWSLNHLAGKSRLKLIKMRTGKGDFVCGKSRISKSLPKLHGLLFLGSYSSRESTKDCILCVQLGVSFILPLNRY